MARLARMLVATWLAVLVGAVFQGCTRSATGVSDDTMTPAANLTDFSSLAPPGSPNNWLVAPTDFAGAAEPDETASVFDVAPSTLADAWRTVIARQPRTAILATSEDGLRLEAQQKSAVFGFVDRISVEVVPVAADRSTFIAYSTSRVGYWDMGVNRDRLRSWIADVRDAARSAPMSR